MNSGSSVKIQQNLQFYQMEEQRSPDDQNINNLTRNLLQPFQQMPQIKIEDMRYQQELEEQREIYFLSFFSPKETAQSIQRKNQSMEMINFQKSEEEPDQIYNRRKRKIGQLLGKDEQLLQTIRMIRQQNYGQYLSIIDFVTFFYQVKSSIPGIRTDYYSNKTFLALKNSNEQEIQAVLKIFKKIYKNICQQPPRIQQQVVSLYSSVEKLSSQSHKLIQFLILPRFLISRQKINKLIKDEQLQKNFQFLIQQQCLGHYNNEANKKMPEEKQMEFVKQLLKKHNGRDRFKKICSINHGNKFSIKYPLDYYQLYSRSLEYLQYLDLNLKKGKKYEVIKKQLQKIPMLTTEQTKGNSGKEGFSESQSSSAGKIYSFKTIEKQLNKIANDGQNSVDQEMRDSLEMKQISPLRGPNMRKFQIKKLMSFPTSQIKQEPIRSFRVKKSVTEKNIQTQNIILIPPPKNHQI